MSDHPLFKKGRIPRKKSVLPRCKGNSGQGGTGRQNGGPYEAALQRDQAAGGGRQNVDDGQPQVCSPDRPHRGRPGLQPGGGQHRAAPGKSQIAKGKKVFLVISISKMRWHLNERGRLLLAALAPEPNLPCLVTVQAGNLSNLHNPVRPGEQTQGQFQLEFFRSCPGVGGFVVMAIELPWTECAGNTGRTCYLIGGCVKRCNGLQRLT